MSSEPDQIRHAPQRHLSKKYFDSAEYAQAFDLITDFLSKDSKALDGYVEGEYIALDMNIEEKPFSALNKLPFSFDLRDVKLGEFREDEIHLTLNKDKSDSKLISAMKKMGFFSVQMMKQYGIAEIFTVQGTKEEIESLIPLLISYLNATGGAVNCSLKEERIISYWTSSPNLKLPPVISNLKLY